MAMVKRFIVRTTKRTGYEIVKDILEVVVRKNPVRMTHVMTYANLSHDQMQNQLQRLLDARLIEKTSDKENRYLLSPTDKGRSFLNDCRSFEARYAEVMGAK